MYLRIYLNDLKTKILLLLNVLIIVIFYSINIANLSEFMARYSVLVFPLFVIIIVISNQSLNDQIYRNILVEGRSKSVSQTSKRIIVKDLFIIGFYGLTNSILVLLILLLRNALYWYEFLYYMPLMFIWLLFFTAMKHLLNAFIHNSSLSGLITSIVVLAYRTINAYAYALYDNYAIALTSIVISVLALISVDGILDKVTIDQ